MYRVEIEDLVANYFIYHSLLNHESRFVRFSTLYEYGTIVVEKLNACGKDTILSISWEDNLKLFRDHGDFFCRHVDDEGYVGIMLHKGITRLDIVKEFLGVIPVDVENVLVEIIRKENQ